MSLKMTRAKLESLTNSLIERTREPCKKCLKDADISPSDIKVRSVHVLVFGFWRC
jgi:molecular chaperone DnaK